MPDEANRSLASIANNSRMEREPAWAFAIGLVILSGYFSSALNGLLSAGRMSAAARMQDMEHLAALRWGMIFNTAMLLIAGAAILFWVLRVPEIHRRRPRLVLLWVAVAVAPFVLKQVLFTCMLFVHGAA